jgi:hypothetical protein
MTTAAQTLEVSARDHAAVADENNALEPETALQIVNDARHCPHIAPIPGKHMMGNRPTIDQHQADEHLRVARLAIPTVAMRGQTRWPVALLVAPPPETALRSLSATSVCVSWLFTWNPSFLSANEAMLREAKLLDV